MMRIRTLIISVLLSCACQGIFAQTLPQFMPEHQARQYGIRPVDANPSDMAFAPGCEYGSISVSADATGGSLHRAQQPEQALGLQMSALGKRQVGRFMLRGSFLFRQSYEDGISYASTFRPTRPMPYVIADSTGGDWKKQDYRMCVDIAMPVVRDRLAAGLAMGLEVGRGAKNSDPRPQAGLCNIDIAPSLSLYAGAAGVFSAGFVYSMFRETSNLILYDSSRPQKLYLLKGLGQYTYEVFSTTERERKSDGNSIGAKLGWSKSAGPAAMALRAEYRNGMEKVYDIDYSKPHDRGAYITHDFESGLDLSLERASWSLDYALSWQSNLGSGRESIQHFDASPEVNSWVTDSENPGRYTRRDDRLATTLQARMRDAGQRQTWKMGVDVELLSVNEQYRATSSLLRQSTIGIRPFAERQIHTNGGCMELGLGVGIMQVLDSELQYSIREKDDLHISEGLVFHDYFLPLDRYEANLGAGYVWNLRKGGSIGLRLDAGYTGALNDARLEDERYNGLKTSGRWVSVLALSYSF